MPRWRNWERSWSGRPPPLTCGSPGWAGAVKKTLHAAEQSRPDVAEQRKQWPQRLAGVSARQLVFVDESGANTQMTRRYGRSPVGQRLACCVPHGHYQTTTLIAAVRLKGAQAPWLFGGAMDGELVNDNYSSPQCQLEHAVRPV